MAESFYKPLYSSVTNAIDFQEKFLNSLPQKISDEQNALLCEPLSKSEVEYALNTIKNVKHLGQMVLVLNFLYVSGKSSGMILQK